MKTKLEIIESIAEEVGGEVYRGYSGRSMYGKRCLGISCDSATECIEAAARKGVRRAVTDQLGRGYIVYWPSIADEAVAS